MFGVQSKGEVLEKEVIFYTLVFETIFFENPSDRRFMLQPS